MADDGTKRHAPLSEYRRNHGLRRRSSIEILRISVEKNVRSIVLEDILPNLVTQHGIPTSNVIASCNVLCTFSQKIIDEACDILESVFRCFLPCLLHHVREVRISALRAIRYLIRTGSHFEVFIKLHLDYLIARSLDLSTEASRPASLHQLEQCESVQALRLVSHLVHVDPHQITPSLVRPLIAIAKEAMTVNQSTPGNTANSEENNYEQTTRACLLILTELALLNPRLVYRCGGVSVMLDSILSSILCSSMRIPEAMLLAILHLMNVPETRKLFPDCQYLERLISPLTSPSIYQLSLKNRKANQESQLSEMRLASSALLITLRSWSGLLYLCQPNSTGIKSLTDVLVVGTPELQRHLLDLLYDVFHVQKLPSDSLTSFETALESIESQVGNPAWSLLDGFVAEEGLSLLNYRSVSKMNLIDNHIALLIIVFYSKGLIEGLCRLLTQSNTEELSVMAGVLLAELMHLSSVLLAPDHPLSQSAGHSLSLLLDNDQSRRVMHWLERVHRLKEQTPQPYSPFLSFIISSACAPPAPTMATATNAGSVANSGGHAGSRISTMSSVVPGSNALTSGIGSTRIASLLSSTSNIASSGWLSDASEERPSRHGSLTGASHMKLVEAVVDRVVIESGVLPPIHHRTSSSASSSSPPIQIGQMGVDTTTPDHWHWDQILCTIRRLLDSVCPACGGQGTNFSQVNVTNIVGHSFTHHSHLHHHHPQHHHHRHDGRNNCHGSTSGMSGDPGFCQNVQHVPTTRLVSWDEPNRARFLRRLMTFFSFPPSVNTGSLASNSYSAQNSSSTLHSHPNLTRHHSMPTAPGYFVTRPHNWVWAHKAATVATELFSLLALYPPDSEPGSLLTDVLSQFASAVRRVCPNMSEDGGGSFFHDSTLSPGTLERTCAYLMFLPVCRLTWSEKGEQLLESQAVSEALVNLITFTQCPLYIKLVISSLDYSRQCSLSRLLLDRATTASCEEGRLYVARFLRVLLRADLPFFSHWGIELVHKQVHDAYLPVCREALSTLQEACEEDSNLVILARLKPALLHQNFAGHAVACRLLGSLQEFRRLKLKNWIKPELDEWTGNGSFVSHFVEHIEESLFEAMTSYTPPTQLGDDLDRLSSNPRKVTGRYVLAPMHPFGSLARHKEGMEFLKESGYLEGVLTDVRNGMHISRKADPTRLRRLKASLWSLGQLGSSTWGFDWLVGTDAIQEMLCLASDAEVLSIRGHAFWCLGLIGSTPRGAEILRHNGWSALRSDRLDIWPLQLPQWDRNRYGGGAGKRILSIDSTGSSSGGGLIITTRRDTRTESLTSSCESRKSTFESTVSTPGAVHSDWVSWLGSGTSTVRSLGREVDSRNLSGVRQAMARVNWQSMDTGNGSDILGYATLGRLRNYPSLFASGSAHDLDGATGSSVVKSGLHPVGGSLSSLQNAAGLENEEPKSAIRKLSLMIPRSFPIEYRGISLPISCYVLSSGLYRSASTASHKAESTLYCRDGATHSDTEANNEPSESDFINESHKDVSNEIMSSTMIVMDGHSDESGDSLSSASTSDYFSRTRSGSIGPSTMNHIPSQGDAVSAATDPAEEKQKTSEVEEEEGCEEDCNDNLNEESSTGIGGGPDPLTGLEYHSKESCIVCSCGREPSEEFSLSMAKPRLEVMDRVEKLMSHIHPRKHEIALLAMRERYPELLQDFCLFSEIALILANYRFNRAARTFLQEVFLELETVSLYKLAQTALPPLPEESDES